ncbi:MAG: acyl-CoA thioesterase [Xanthomonadaceae bacterium]|nr:acyl-CoA thioesterase [Xanthomonadaceae bacterium]
MPPAFRYRLRVRYAECDAQKVVFNARYGDYIDLAATEFMRALGYGEALLDGRLDYQLVRQTIEWRAPAHFDDVLSISVSSPRQGNTSFSLAFEFRRAGDDVVLASAETVYVLVSPALVKTAIPDALRASLIAGAGDVVTCHAGWQP